MSGLRCLIVGGGVAGPCAAWWLAKAGATITIIERSSALYNRGQSIDLQPHSKEIIRRMGLLDKVVAKKIREKAVVLVNEKDAPLSRPSGMLTNEHEIMRGDLAQLMTEAADSYDNVSVQFDTTVTSIRQTPTNVYVTYNNGHEAEFDVLIAADGARSRTRDMIVDEAERENCLHPLNVHIAFFSIPHEPQDGDTARWLWVPGKSLLIRPVDEKKSSAFLITTTDHDRLDKFLKSDRQTQKNAVKEVFTGMGGDSERCLREMDKTDDFYFESITQIKLKKWYNGRCALLGDAAYCPTVLTGSGTHVAIWGAYILAGELSKNPNDPAAALQAYDKTFRPHLEEIQKMPFGEKTPRMLYPQTKRGVWLLRTILRTVIATRITDVFAKFESDKFELPEYKALYQDSL